MLKIKKKNLKTIELERELEWNNWLKVLIKLRTGKKKYY